MYPKVLDCNSMHCRRLTYGTDICRTLKKKNLDLRGLVRGNQNFRSSSGEVAVYSPMAVVSIWIVVELY